MKRVGRWALYALLFLVAGGLIESGTKGAVALLAIVFGWSAYKFYPLLVGIRDALDRLSRAPGTPERLG